MSNSAEVFSYGVIPSFFLLIGIVAVLFFILRLIQFGMTETGDHRSLHRKFARGDVKEMRRRKWAAGGFNSKNESKDSGSPPPVIPTV